MNQPCPLTAAEAKEADRIKRFVGIDRDYAQKSADIWMRSAPNPAAVARRKQVVKDMGLTAEIQYL